MKPTPRWCPSNRPYFLGTLDEVAATVGFLASPRASLVNGHVLLVDDGWVAW
ncbi:MAG: SDR family oxidoreductase [Actinobacteria bacterium]|nr:SDR family oxidoreductase [Actinomycetota bacterium]